MGEANVHPIIEPDADQMTQHLELLFGGDLGGKHDGLIEIAWRDANTGNLSKAELFGTGNIEDAVEKAVEVNRVHGQNVYVGAALRKPSTAPFARCEDEDFYALPAYYADLDDDGVAASAKERYAHCKPSAVVITGASPYPRAQLWWRQENPDNDPDSCRRQNHTIATALRGDQTVVNPSRVMRLAGSIAWPVKEGRKVELTALVIPDGAPSAYIEGQIARAFPQADDAREQTQPENHALDIGGAAGADVSALMAAIKSGDHWHNNLVALTGHWIGRGWSDEEIIAAAEGMTLPGYTVNQTRAEAATMISGGREKWDAPNPENVVEDISSDIAPAPGWTFDFTNIAPRRWILGDRLIRGFVTLTMAPGGVSKSTLTMEEAIAVAIGRSITGADVHDQRPTWIFNNEDPLDELQRRIAAICIYFGIDREQLKNRLYLNSGLAERIVVAKTVRNAVVQTPVVDAFKQHIREHGIGVLVIDPFVRWHDVVENDNAQIDFVVRQFASIADETGCAVSLVHHTRKAPAGTSYAGDADSARGASALVYACRAAFTLMEMSASEAMNLGIEEERRRWYVRLDNAKGNLSPPAENATWFERKSVELPNGTLNIGTGDQVGVLVPWDAPSAEYLLTPLKATEILKDVEARWNEGQPFGDDHRSGDRYLVNHIVAEHSLTKPQAKKVLKDWLKSGMLVREKFDPKGKKFGLRVMKWPGKINLW